MQPLVNVKIKVCNVGNVQHDTQSFLSRRDTFWHIIMGRMGESQRAASLPNSLFIPPTLFVYALGLFVISFLQIKLTIASSIQLVITTLALLLSVADVMCHMFRHSDELDVWVKYAMYLVAICLFANILVVIFAESNSATFGWKVGLVVGSIISGSVLFVCTPFATAHTYNRLT